ncbi:MAG: PAS domain S-box protein [Nostocales cyanobacterium ELA583]|jgi:PAS domain S-box-containing protein
MTNKFVSTLSDIERSIIQCPLILSPETPAMEAIQLMSQVRDSCHLPLTVSQSDINLLNQAEKASCILADKNNKLVGIFTERDIVKYTAMGLNLESVTLADVMVKNPVTLKKSEFTNIFVVLNLFRQHKIRNLVIVDDQDHIVGLVTPTTIRQLLQAGDLFKIRTIGDAMTSEVIQTPPTTSILKLAQLMADYSVSCVVITESDSQPIGIVTERDIVQIQALELNIRELEAHTVMSAPLFCMRPHESLWEANQQMERQCIRRLVVLGNRDQLVGIVTQSSVLYSLDPLEMYETVSLLQNKIYQLESEKVEILERQNTELETQVQERTSKLIEQANVNKLLATLSEKIRNSLNIEYILQTTVSEIQEYLQIERVIIYEFESGGSGKVIAESLAPGITSILGRIIDDSCFAERWLQPYINGRVGRIEDIYTAEFPDCYFQLLNQVQIRANLVVPIVYNNQPWGLLCANQCSQPRNWESTEVELLEKLSIQIAIAIQQSQLYQQAQKELWERQQAEINLKKINEELENRVAQRTTELRQINHELLLEIQRGIQAEKTLKKQLTAIEATIDGIAILRDNKFIFLNKAHTQMFGYDTAEELIGKHWTELYKPEEIARIEQKVFPILGETGYWRGEATAKRRDGSTFNEEVSLTITHDGELICVCQDITESKKAQAKLQKSLRELSQFKYALNQSALVSITDPQGKITYVNDNFCQMSQYSKEELIGRTHKIVNSGYHSKEFFQNLWNTIYSGQVWRGEIRNQAKDRTFYWVDSTIIPFLKVDGQPWQYLSIRNDITNRKLAESALQESEQKFRQLAENLNQIFWISDPETSQIIYISPAYEEIWGLSCTSLYENPKSFTDAVYPDDLPQFIMTVQNKKNGFDTEYRIKRPDSSIRWIHDRAFPLKDATGEVYRVVGIAEDITQRKQVEEEIQKALAKEKELSELKSRFVSMTSHEFRTPLAVISSSAEILRNFGHRLEEKSKREHLECIQTYVNHTTQLLDDILLINKAETGNLAFQPAPLDLVPFCQSLTQEIQLSSSNHTIVFASNSQSNIIGNFDKKILRQILSNLLSNAIKYSPNSAIVNFNLDTTESNVIFSIQDQGIGIPEADQVKLFESFHRAKNVGNIPGTGLGLSIVAKCVDLHKGAIAVNSQLGRGTTFIVTIPLNKLH